MPTDQGRFLFEAGLAVAGRQRAADERGSTRIRRERIDRFLEIVPSPTVPVFPLGSIRVHPGSCGANSGFLPIVPGYRCPIRVNPRLILSNDGP